MAIEREYGKLVPTCDVCYIQLDEEDTFDDAIASMKDHGWKSVRIDGEFEDHCSECCNNDA